MQHKCVYGIHNNNDHIDEGRQGWKKGERGGRMERGGRKEKEDGKNEGDRRERKKGGEGREKRNGRRLPPVLPLINSGTIFVFLESQMHITPLSFEN